ncbi:MAG: hypothetical protein HY929_00655 [Euryarchaeota archaeon]|nr:hypothetical protein [Euryarchaeota archaeon]
MVRTPKESEKSIVELVKAETNPKITLTPSKIALKTGSSVYSYHPTDSDDYKKTIAEIIDVIAEKRGVVIKPEVKEEVKVEEKLEEKEAEAEEKGEKKKPRKPSKRAIKRKELEELTK